MAMTTRSTSINCITKTLATMEIARRLGAEFPLWNDDYASEYKLMVH